MVENEGFVFNLPPDIHLPILVRLPAKSLVRFKSVCKQWLHIIQEDPTFINMHMEQFKNDDSFLFIMSSEGCRELFSINKQGLTEIRHCRQNTWIGKNSESVNCNGLLCYYDFMISKVIIWNPNTDEELWLPKSEFIPSGLGFGFDPSTKQYKVVLFGMSGGQVFTLGTSKWRPTCSEPILNDLWENHYMDPVCTNDTLLHWLSVTCIISFDLKSEEFTEIQFPDHGVSMIIHPCLSPYYLLELNDYLCIVSSAYGTNNMFELWVLKGRENNVWVKEEHMFTLPENYCRIRTSKPSLSSRNGEILAHYFNSSPYYQYIHSYNPQTFSTKTIMLHGHAPRDFKFTNFRESLVRLEDLVKNTAYRILLKHRLVTIM